MSGHVGSGLRQGLHLVVTGNHELVDVTLNTLKLAGTATAIGALIGLPLGCALGLGTARWVAVLRAAVLVVARVPPVISGLVVVLLVTEASPYGGGPLAGLHWDTHTPSAYLAQTLLALPLVTALTAAAVAAMDPGLLRQARALGASGRHLGLLALQEMRRRVLAAVIVALGVTITSIGAIAVAAAPTAVATKGATEPSTLAVGAYEAITESGVGGSDHFDPGNPDRPTPALAVAYATVLLGLFALLAGSLTWLQQPRLRWRF